MEKFKVLYNPNAGTVNAEDVQKQLTDFLVGETLEFFNLTEIENYAEFFKGVESKENILLVGGDGTLNRFVNDTEGLNLKNKISYFAAGSGNDFWTDLGKVKGEAPLCIDEYLKNLPTVCVNGKSYKFVNGVGYGIDGYCCEVADKLKEKGKKVNYTSIAIKGLLFHFKPRKATVTVDGVTKTYKKCWIAPTMNGRFYGGGMIPTPAQKRNSGAVSSCILYGAGKIRTLMVFPSIFKGEHIKKTKMCEVLSGREICVKFDKPCALQIDGETILNVSEYTVTAAENAAEVAA